MPQSRLLTHAKHIRRQIIADRRLLHKNPEINLETPKTAAIIKTKLAEMGITASACGGRVPVELRKPYLAAGQPGTRSCTGIIADIGRGSPRVLLRAAIDALPMKELSGMPYASRNGFSHTCANDANTAMLLGAARLLKPLEREMKGSVRLMFQPGDQLACGAAVMIQDGALNGVDSAVCLNADTALESGQLCVTPGVASASLDSWFFKILGRGGDTAAPGERVDAMMIAGRLYETLYLLVTRETAPHWGASLTAGVFRESGLPAAAHDIVELHAAIRLHSEDGRAHMLKRVPDAARHIVAAWRGAVEIQSVHTRPAVNDPALTAALDEWLAPMLPHGVQTVPPSDMAFDYGNISALVPSVGFAYGMGGPGAPRLHNPAMAIDEKALPAGAALWAAAALCMLDVYRAK